MPDTFYTRRPIMEITMSKHSRDTKRAVKGAITKRIARITREIKSLTKERKGLVEAKRALG